MIATPEKNQVAARLCSSRSRYSLEQELERRICVGEHASDDVELSAEHSAKSRSRIRKAGSSSPPPAIPVTRN